MLSPQDHARIKTRLASMRPALELIGGDVRSPRRSASTASGALSGRRGVNLRVPAASSVDEAPAAAAAAPEKSQFEIAHKKMREKEMKQAAKRMVMMENSERALREEHKRNIEAGVVETDEEKSVRRQRMREMRRTRKAAQKRAKKTRKQMSHNVRLLPAAVHAAHSCCRCRYAPLRSHVRARLACAHAPLLPLLSPPPPPPCAPRHATLPVPRDLADPDGD
jgi:hypothetical protein